VGVGSTAVGDRSFDGVPATAERGEAKLEKQRRNKGIK